MNFLIENKEIRGRVNKNEKIEDKNPFLKIYKNANKHKLIQKYCLFFFVSFFLSCKSEKKSSPNKPNIIIIYTDDLGYGDVSAYKKGALNTPNIDRIANEGIRFNNGYSSSATCSPSRYALLTGIYPWRKSGLKVITGGGLSIDTTTMTIPRMLKENGYNTGIR